MNENTDQKIRNLISLIYGRERESEITGQLFASLDREAEGMCIPADAQGRLNVDEKDSIMITYGDQFYDNEKSPLKVLKEFLDTFMENSISGVHILPFSPYSSDDGFSVIDYREVNPDLGSWEDVEEIGKSFRLMADLVLNHCSAKSIWFRKFLEWDEKYRDFFITADPQEDLSMVFRPRALPLLTPYNTADGEKHVWTTFSADQVDLNFANPEVLKEMLSIFLMYIKKGVQIIRLDAIAFLWKESGHTCLHHEKTHAVVKLFRLIAEKYAPHVIIITETNVPHRENLSYFGSGYDEAHMVYQFALPPLTLDAFLRQDASRLREWASSSLDKPSDDVSFFNFLASHDGIGVLPSKGILSSSEIDNMLSEVKKRGGLISYKATAAGDIPYEMNINYRSAVSGDEKDEKTAIGKYIASQALMLAFTGMPGIYVHSLIGSVNYSLGVNKTGMNRTINREKLDYNVLKKELENPESSRKIIIESYKKLINARKKEKAFNPGGEQKVLDSKGALFALLRISPDRKEKILCLYNISGKILKSFPGWDICDGKSQEDDNRNNKNKFMDIITGKISQAVIISGKSPMITLKPWECVWLKL